MSQSIPNSSMTANMHDGYLSEDSKRTFTITAGILGAVFFFMQIFTPFLAMMLMAPVFMATSFNLTRYDLERAAVHDGNLYLFSEGLGPKMEIGSSKLIRLDLTQIPQAELTRKKSPIRQLFGFSEDEGVKPEEIAEIGGESPWLLAGGEKLLLISQSTMWELRGSELVEAGSYAALGNISRPFYFDKSPAVIEGKPDGLFLAVYEAGQWRRSPIFLEKGEDFRNVECRVQTLSIDGTNHLFLKIGDTVFHRIGLPLGHSRDAHEEWRSVGAADLNWQSFELDGKPGLLSSGGKGLKGFLFEDGRWSQTFHASFAIAHSFDLLPLPGDGSLRVAASGFPRSLRIYSIEDDKLLLNARFGGDFPFPRTFMPMMFIPHIANMLFPIVLAVILSGLMLKHRVTVHSHGGETAQYASLTRRALAQVVDGMILFAGMLPLALQWFNMFDMFEMFENETDMIMFPILMIASFAFTFLWTLFLLLAFSLTEGKWGATPGKWLVGIRVVGTDHRPCGFGRALLRNFLKVVDGFFNFMVGMLIVTFTKDWQRVGDMAARTIVIRKTPTAQPPMRADSVL